jgi:hypothetical protein
MPMNGLTPINRPLISLAIPLLTGLLIGPAAAQSLAPSSSWDPLTGPRSRLARDWQGMRPLSADTEILVMPGHADSQGVAGSGTSGEAVALRGARPMQPGISDELHWNLLTAQAIVRLGQQRGLRTWSVGRSHAAAGGYALEIHYDAYGPDGVGSGLIPPFHRPPSRIDESLAQEFGNFPLRFRDGLGAPRRGVAILEIGKLEGPLERSLRDPRTSPATLDAIADRVVRALARGLDQPPIPALSPAPDLSLSPQPDGVSTEPQALGLPASSGAL